MCLLSRVFHLDKTTQLVSARCLLTHAETQGGRSAIQARDKTLLAPLADKANWSKVLFLVSLFSAVELL